MSCWRAQGWDRSDSHCHNLLGWLQRARKKGGLLLIKAFVWLASQEAGSGWGNILHAVGTGNSAQLQWHRQQPQSQTHLCCLNQNLSRMK